MAVGEVSVLALGTGVVGGVMGGGVTGGSVMGGGLLADVAKLGARSRTLLMIRACSSRVAC
jgi:hypothetical protein